MTPDEFWAKAVRPENGCWEWPTRNNLRGGYGAVTTQPATPHLVGPTQPHAAMSQWIGERTSQPTQPRRRK